MSIDIVRYLEMIRMPWGRMFYELAWAQLPQASGAVLDFGSGLGVTANHLAATHNVVAVEPDDAMLSHRLRDCEYEQLRGGVEKLAGMRDRFALAVCHNVLEYVPDRAAALSALCACVREGGALSIIKHNTPGKVMQAAVFEGDPAKALALYRGGDAFTLTMGRAPEHYDDAWLMDAAAEHGLRHTRTLGIRCCYGLGENGPKLAPDWFGDMFALERAVQADPAFVGTAFYHHLLFVK